MKSLSLAVIICTAWVLGTGNLAVAHLNETAAAKATPVTTPAETRATEASASQAVAPPNSAPVVATTELDIPADTESADELLPPPADPEGLHRRAALIASLTIFALAVFVGFEVIAKVPPTLHTPLMSGSNAISGITIVGALLAAGGGQSGFAACLGMLAVAMAMVNVIGGFLVTDRMLSMFRRKPKST